MLLGEGADLTMDKCVMTPSCKYICVLILISPTMVKHPKERGQCHQQWIGHEWGSSSRDSHWEQGWKETCLSGAPSWWRPIWSATKAVCTSLADSHILLALWFVPSSIGQIGDFVEMAGKKIDQAEDLKDFGYV